MVEQNFCKKIKFKSNHKIPPTNIGDNMRVSLLDVDRGRADPSTIIIAIVCIEDGQYYKLSNKYSTRPQLNSKKQSSAYPLTLMPLNEIVHVSKLLRKIASKSPDNGG